MREETLIPETPFLTYGQMIAVLAMYYSFQVNSASTDRNGVNAIWSVVQPWNM